MNIKPNTEKSYVPSLLSASLSRPAYEVAYFIYGVALLGLLAQINIPLTWTPVPITGQTMGVTLLSLLWGRKRAPAIVLSYVSLSALGFPLLAGQVALSLGPTNGYLVGMILASYWLGYLADRGCTENFWTCWLAGISGSAIVLFSGAVGLAFYLPLEKILWAGVIPFLPGDFIKTLLACTLAYQFSLSLEPG